VVSIHFSFNTMSARLSNGILLTIFLVFTLISFLTAFMTGNSCTREKCKLPNTNEPREVVCCSNHGVNLQLDLRLSGCFFNCNITCYHNTPCDSPAFCGAMLGRGIFGLRENSTRNPGCQCNLGWTGADCSQIRCPNPCSRKGVCVKGERIDFCKCFSGYTGIDCASRSFTLEPFLPYGELVAHRPYWSSKEEYGDIHPLFNVSTHSYFHLFCNETDFRSLFDPFFTWQRGYIPCDCHYHNSHNATVHIIRDCGVRLKGAFSRHNLKKSLRVSFTQFGYNGRRFFGVSALGFKGSSDPSYSRAFIGYEMMRALGIPVQRSAFASVFINGRSVGLYWMSEEVNGQFFKSRYEDQNGNCYKIAQTCGNLYYFGDDPAIYKSLNKTRYGGKVFGQIYEAESEAPDYRDLTRLIMVLNKTRDPMQFQNDISQILNVDLALRYLLTEMIIVNMDGLTMLGNNYFLYNNPKTITFDLLPYDLDLTFFLCWI